MSTVQQKIKSIEDKKHRALELAQEERSKNVSKMFFDERQTQLYGPFANIISVGTSYESLYLPDPSGESEEKVEAIFLFNMEVLSGGDKEFAQRMLTKLNEGGFDSTSISFINASIDDVKTKMKVQFNGLKTSEPAIFLFLKKYVQTFDSNNDGVRDNDDNSDTEAVDKPLHKSRANTKPDLLEYIQSSFAKDPDFRVEVEEYAKSKMIYLHGKKNSDSIRSNISVKDLDTIVTFMMEKRKGNTEQTAVKGVGKGVGGRLKKRLTFAGRGVLPANNISDKIYVDISHLNKNSLALKYKSTKKLIGKPQTINDEQKESIMAILKGEYTKKQYDKLRSGSKELVHDFAIASKAKHVEYIVHGDELMNKFNVIIGEIEAGNDSPDLRKMLKEATTELLKIKRISKLEALSILSQIE